MSICSTLEIKNMSNICNFDGILKTEINMQYFSRNCRIKNLDYFERDKADAYLWNAGILNMKEKGMTICYNYEQVLGNVFERRESKCCGVLMKHCCKMKCEQLIALQMAQQLKTKNINVAPGQLFCRQCKAKCLLETDSLY